MREYEKQFGEAFEAYSDELFRYASMRMKDRERALELTQECFMKVWEYAQKHEGDAKEVRELRPFLYRTLRHLIIDEYRRKKPVSLEGLASASQEASVEDLLPPDESNTMERAVERFDGKLALAALEQLPEPYREAVSLRYVEGLSPKEIADITDESENVVSVRVHRGLQKLKAILEKHVA